MHELWTTADRLQALLTETFLFLGDSWFSLLMYAKTDFARIRSLYYVFHMYPGCNARHGVDNRDSNYHCVNNPREAILLMYPEVWHHAEKDLMRAQHTDSMIRLKIIRGFLPHVQGQV